jgi:hypothetical protein
MRFKTGEVVAIDQVLHDTHHAVARRSSLGDESCRRAEELGRCSLCPITHASEARSRRRPWFAISSLTKSDARGGAADVIPDSTRALLTEAGRTYTPFKY